MTTAELTVMNADNLTAEAFQINTDAIRADVDMYSKMTISGIEDKEGFKRVREGRLMLKRVRTDIEKRRKELKEGALAYGKKVDAVAKELTALVAPAEDVLESREKEHLLALDTIENAKLDERMAKLAAVGNNSSRLVVKAMSDKLFDECLTAATEEHAKQVEAARLAEEEHRKAEEAAAEARRLEDERLKAEREKLDAERREFEAKRKVQEEACQAQEAEAARVRAEEETKLQAQRDELARQQAEIDAANAEREQLARDIAEAEQRALQEADRLSLIEECKPDRAKLQKVIDTISNLRLPATTTPNGQAMADYLDACFGELVDECEAKLNELLPAT
jgi:hypothetical protein